MELHTHLSDRAAIYTAYCSGWMRIWERLSFRVEVRGFFNFAVGEVWFRTTMALNKSHISCGDQPSALDRLLQACSVLGLLISFLCLT